MKKVLSAVLAAVMLLCVAIPVFAEGGSYNVTFQAPGAGLITSHDGKDLGPAYYFVKCEGDHACFEEDPNGIYYEANDGNYYTRDQLIENTIPADAKTYSPVVLPVNSQVAYTAGSTLAFRVFTNEAYNPATVTVRINGAVASRDEMGIYRAAVNGDLDVTVDEGALLRSRFNVVLTSSEGYSVRMPQGENYHLAYYGDSFRFRVRVASGYSDANMKVTLVRGSSQLAEFLGEDADILSRFTGASETLYSDGVDSDGCRTYTINNITSDCKISVSGVRETKKATVLTYLKRILKMILDVFHIDTSFLGLDEVIGLTYYSVNVNNNVPADADLDYFMVTGVEDPFKMDMFNVMSGEGVTIEFKTYDVNVKDRLVVTWSIGDRTVTGYANTWTAVLNQSTGKTYYKTTFMIDNINANTNVNISLR